jgi:CRP/FNR family transcriptional regulator, dissimilatory nitrate respiration regulator
VLPEFDGLSERLLATIAALAIEQRFAPRRTLYRAGDPVSGLYFILAGRVRVSRETESQTHMLHFEGAGGMLGEIPVFGGGSFPATAVATEPTRCLHVPVDAVERLLRNEPEFARFALRRLAIRARSLLRRIDELTTTTITARVAAYLLDRAAESENGEFTLGMSQQALAEELDTAREVIVRSLGALIDAQAISRVGRSRFAVRRMATLRAIASV